MTCFRCSWLSANYDQMDPIKLMVWFATIFSAQWKTAFNQNVSFVEIKLEFWPSLLTQCPQTHAADVQHSSIKYEHKSGFTKMIIKHNIAFVCSFYSKWTGLFVCLSVCLWVHPFTCSSINIRSISFLSVSLFPSCFESFFLRLKSPPSCLRPYKPSTFQKSWKKFMSECC